MQHENARGGARVRFPPPLVYLLAIVTGVALKFIYPLALPWFWLRIVGGGALVVGVFLLLAAARLFSRTGQNPAPWEPTPELVFAGVYRFTRNPMYVGMACIQLGIGLALGNGWVVAFAPLSLVAVHFIAVRREEAYLEERFGEPYRDYKRQVRRYL